MSVTVILPQALRSDCDGASRVTLPFAAREGVVLREVIDELTRHHPRVDRRIRDDQGHLRRYVNVFVGADECRSLNGLDTPVADGTEVRVLPSIAGG